MLQEWGGGPEQALDDLDRLAYLCNLIGVEKSLAQPGGGNSSIKLESAASAAIQEDILAVKGSGADLGTITRDGFTRLSRARLAGLARRADMTDAAMMDFMASCMLHPHRDPIPSVETPLHAMLPARVIVHTHDVMTMSLTNIRSDRTRHLIRDLFSGHILPVPYARPGFPLARQVMKQAAHLTEEVWGLALAHHGLVIWHDAPEPCYQRLVEILALAEDFLASRRAGRHVFGPPASDILPASRRRERAGVLLPVLRGFLGREAGGILHWDSSDRILDTLARPRFESLSQRGMATPEHILRAGRLPLWLPLDLQARDQALEDAARRELQACKDRYQEYHKRHAGTDQPLIPDWAKIVLIPGFGMVSASQDKRGAMVAAACYGATIDTIENAEALDRFCFLPEAEVFEFEHWPLERRKVDEALGAAALSRLLPGQVMVVVGGASGIGRAAALRCAEEGAHVVVGDLDAGGAERVAAEIHQRFPHRALAAGVDVREAGSLARLMRDAVCAFGGLDGLFYTPGLAPRFTLIRDLERKDLLQQLEVHYMGALLAIRAASRVMERQGRGGSIVCSVSKAALAAGRQAAAYGGSKAALQHALRVAAVELGPAGIRVNAINADQVETPLFLRFAAARARAQGRSLEEQLEEYRRRNVLGQALIPARAVAELVVLLASERFRYTTGDILTIDGGLPDAFPR